ncbi:hypothetical protein [Nocardioides caldifontis]|uniref:hypothetical protein n=1 Tax=Nocardioides caldifontis TaxID=2588938 RepID=UPI0011E0082F|nr:hypothetical protein [Nocardioides caldifontis]
MRRTATAALTGLVATTAAVVLVSAGASQAAGTKSYVYGLDIVAQGQSQVRQPYVESTDGSEQTGVGSALPENPLLTGEVGLFRAGNDSASMTLADISVGGGIVDQLPPEFAEGLAQLQPLCEQVPETPAEIPEIPELPIPLDEVLDVRTACESLASGELTDLLAVDLVEVACEGDSGTVDIGGVTLLGLPVDVPALEPDTAILPENPGLTITANRQTAHEDGSFTIDALVVDLAGEAEVVLGSATCGEPLPTEPAVEEPEPDLPPLAPAPEPVRGNLPVTG